jgi:hypothetical protein
MPFSLGLKEGWIMPLTQKVAFKAVLQKGNRVQVPKLIRWQFKMETDQTLKVGVRRLNFWRPVQFFYAKMGKDGRIFIPELVLAFFQEEKQSLAGHVFEVTLEPT